MATDSRYRVSFRRKREGKTDYRKRVRLLLSQKSRIAVRTSGRHCLVQLLEYRPEGDRVIVSAHSNELKKHGWRGATSNLPALYLTGYLCGLKMIQKGRKEAILDVGLAKLVRGSKIYGALKGIVDAGVAVPHDPEIFPREDRIRGEHIAQYAALLKEKKTVFSQYLQHDLDPAEVSSHFQEVLGKISEAYKGG
jgi:large subunit ribosomal protein L18